MKKYLRILFVSALFLSIGFVYVQNVQASDKSFITDKITSAISKDDEVKKVFYADYDRNGRKEAFVITGKESKQTYDDYETLNTLWFAYVQDGAVYTTKIRDDVYISSKMLKLKSVTLFCAAEYCSTDLPMDVYKVVGNNVQYIFQGADIKKGKGNNFTSVHSAYDAAYDEDAKTYMGHTWKRYYFYYKNGQIKQYKAKYISKKNLQKKYKNGKSILKKYDKKGIKSILYRSNGLVHISYGTKNNQYQYATYRIKGKKLVKYDSGGGFYLKKLKKWSYSTEKGL